MRQKKMDSLDSLIDQAVNAPDSIQRNRIAAQARKKIVPKKKMGAPSLYSEAKAAVILKRIENGETLTSITKELGLSLDCIYGWLKNYPDFAERYQSARESMARSLADELLDEVKSATPDKALLLKTKGAIMQWAIARYGPKEFSDSKRLEISAQVDHKHVHELTIDQRKRIAESWLLSQSDNAPLIEAQTTGPDMPGVESVADKVEREIPKRKAPAQKKRVETDDW